MPREYSVGYKKPPVEYRFKKGNLAAHRRASLKDKVPDLVSHLNRPFDTERGGKRVKVHPFEAALLSLARDAMKGKPSAIKKIIQIFEGAGLLDPPPAKQTHGVLVGPKHIHPEFFYDKVQEILGISHLDPELFEAARVEYDQDQAQIKELRLQFLRGQNNG
ncbi:hypothetical protein [Nitrobacter sp. TKz-YC02]|uniref:hypothetical protein n=1 Tax=Nitrobacter sp. TKz-YC02 TaxID=3398704 RepID=UPI003CF02D6C